MEPFKLKLEHYLAIAIVLVTLAALSLSWTSPVARAIRNGERINAVIIGTDWVDYARHSDTLIFMSYDPVLRFLDVISIPRDTRFSPPGYQFQRINEIYAYHYRKSQNNHVACQEVRSAVEQLFGNKVTIPYYLRVDYASFRSLINLIGGVNLEVEEPMDYDDNAGKLHIHFEPGMHHLDGQKALEYVRFRGPAGDIGRVFRQQRFFKAVLSQLKNPFLVFKLPHVINALSKEIDTNISFWDLVSGALELKDVGAKNIRLAQLPGAPKGRYWQVDRENCDGLLDKVFPSTGTVVSAGPKVRVEVWNASGKTKLAEYVAWLLRQKGYDVLDWGTFSVRQKKTLIKDLTGDLRSSQKVSDILQCGEVVTRFNAKRFVDISIILGEDCDIADPKAIKKMQ